jgi:hypothetical protein
VITSYQDFEVEITQRDDGVLQADLSIAPGRRRLTRPILITPPRDDRITWAEAGQGRKSEAELAELGRHLFDAIFKGELRDNWNACQGDLHGSPEIGLRLRFSTQFSAFTRIPLELLCSRVEPTCDFLALNPRTPIIRSPRSGKPPHTRKITLPLRMLVVIANYRLAGIDVKRECTSLESSLAGLLHSGKLIIKYLGLKDCPSADFKTLQHILAKAESPYDIIHFIGHGALSETDDKETEGVLLFVDPQNGDAQEVHASDLASTIAENNVCLALLQACEGARDGTANVFQGTAQRLIASGLPAAIAMQWPVDKDVATWFCAELYNFWLAEGGLLLEHAVTEARRAVRQQFRNRPSAWATPVLLLSSESTSALRVSFSRKKARSVHIVNGTSQQAKEADNLEDYKYDVFLSYRVDFIGSWVLDTFVPLLKWFLEEELGRPPQIAFNRQRLLSDDIWPLNLKMELAYSRCLVAIWSPSYFKSSWCMHEHTVMLHREKLLGFRTPENPIGLIIPVVASDGDYFSEFMEEFHNKFDCRDFVIPQPVFAHTQGYLDFRDQMREWAKHVAEAIKQAPSWRREWLTDPDDDIPPTSPTTFGPPVLR